MRTFRAVLTVWLCLGAALTGHAQLSEAEKAVVLLAHHTSVETNIVYKVASGHEAKLDVYRPAHAAGTTPVLMMIHGGGWLFGTKEDSVLYLLPFLQMGFSVVNVEYRMGSVSLAPAAVEDGLCALHWIGRNAKKYEFDLGKVVVTGGSAGGHLALTTAMIPPSAGFENECAYEDDQGWTGTFVDSRPKVAAVVNWFGITDVADMLQGPNMRGYAVSWLGGFAESRGPGEARLAAELRAYRAASDPDHPRRRRQTCTAHAGCATPRGADQGGSAQSAPHLAGRRSWGLHRRTGAEGLRGRACLPGRRGGDCRVELSPGIF